MEVSPLKLLILLVATPVFFFALLAVVMRLLALSVRAISSQVVVLACALLGNLPFGALVWFVYLRKVSTTEELIAGIIYTLLIYNALAYSCFHVFNMSDTARRIKILNEIHGLGKVKISELKSSYSAAGMLANRIDRLLDSRQISRSGNGYVLNSHLLYDMARVLNLWGRILGLSSMKSLYGGKK